MVMLDIMIGRSRAAVLSRTAARIAMPRRRIFCMARSTSRMGLLTTVPIKTRKPSIVIMSNGWLIPCRPIRGSLAPR